MPTPLTRVPTDTDLANASSAVGDDVIYRKAAGTLHIKIGDVEYDIVRSTAVGVILPVVTDANRGAATGSPRVVFNSDDGQLNIADGTNWTLPDGSTT